ncbi:MAG: GtrA family protein [Clostridium neonatale]
MKIDNFIEIIKYGIFGIVTTGINLLLFYALIKFEMNYIISNTVSYLIAVIISYFLNKVYVFKDNNINKIGQMIKFIFVRILSLCAENILLILMVDMLKYNIYISKIFISFLIICSTFIINKIIIFKK